MKAPALSRESAEYLLGYLRDEMLASNDKRAARVAAELERYVDGLARPSRYTLRSDGNAWQIGAGEGLHVKAPNGQVARGLGALELALAYPGMPVRLADFLVPGKPFQSEHGLARKLISVTRRWVGDEIDVGLAQLLTGCKVSTDEFDQPVVTCAPLHVAIVTSYTAS